MADLATSPAVVMAPNYALATPPTYGQVSPLKSGSYGILGMTGSTSNTLGNQNLRVSPVFFARAVTLVRLGAEITGAGESGSVLRLGIFSDTGDLYPGAVLLDAGTIDGTSATVQEITISQQLGPGTYWFGGVVQAAATTQPTVRTVSTSVAATGAAANTGLASGNFVYSQTGVTGALATFSTTVVQAGAVPRVFWKIA